MKILLVVPGFNPRDRFNLLNPLYSVPLALATVAALTPSDVEVDIWDEAVFGQTTHATGFRNEYDLVRVTGYSNHVRRQRELGDTFRQRGITVAVGGAGVSSAPEHYRDYFDILFIGEAEYTWPRFIADWKVDSHRSEYRQVPR